MVNTQFCPYASEPCHDKFTLFQTAKDMDESEKVVQDSLEKLAKNRTTFVIAHRLSTIKNAEKIIVLSEDGIEESGTHEELMDRKGTYEKLYNMQFHK